METGTPVTEGPLSGYTRVPFSHQGRTRDVYRRGAGPGIVVIAEIPGITPRVAEFADRCVDAGFTALLPHLFGTPGREPTMPYILRSLGGACISREFTTFALGRTSPAAVWLRGLASAAHSELGGPGVGAVGMCLTGGFALGMMVEPAVVAPVLSQPSLPFPVSRRHRRDLGVSDADLAVVRERAAETCVLGLRFSNDPAVPAARFERLREELGDDFIGVEIDSSPGNPHGIPRSAHSVLTEHLTDVEGHPTRDALDQVLAFFADRLHR